MPEVAILGSGSWGCALAESLAIKGTEVLLWGRDKKVIDEINKQRTNEAYLPGVKLSESILATTDLDSIKESKVIVVAIPTQKQRAFLVEHQDLLKDKILVNVAKGLEIGTHLRLSEIYQEVFGEMVDYLALYGPSHAEEVARSLPTTLVVAGGNLESAQYVQALFNSKTLRVYTNDDLVGVEYGGALKNMIALAIGMTVGLGYGDNAQAALMTRGLAEITRLGEKMGANPLTFLGLTGVGDLIVTCTSPHSRNRTAGYKLGKGEKLQEVLDNMGMVVEGITTTQATYALAKENGVSAPIVEGLYGVLFEGDSALDMAENLMLREMKRE